MTSNIVCLTELPFSLRVNLLENHKGIQHKGITRFLHLQKLSLFFHTVVCVVTHTYIYIWIDT